MQRSVELSGVACGRRVGGGAGGVRADRHSELSRRLSGRAAGLGAAGARKSQLTAAPEILRRSAAALRSGEIKYVKLLDGGLVDNYGLAGFTIARLASDTPFGPLAPQEAVKLRRFLFLIVDAGRDPSGKWAQTIPGPTGVDLILAASDTATEFGAIGSYSAFDVTMEDWRNKIVAWRCGLSEADRRRFGAPPGWNCRDVQFFISRLTFDDLGPERAAALNAVQTQFKLPPDQVNLLIAAGHDALFANPTFHAFMGTLPRGPQMPPHPRPRTAPVAVVPPLLPAHEARAN